MGQNTSEELQWRGRHVLGEEIYRKYPNQVAQSERSANKRANATGGKCATYREARCTGIE
jgi:hypothetical protein